jgi:tripartite-type tricarboxylate transporter receptor subunit TctC
MSLSRVFLAVVTLAAFTPVFAQQYPAKPVRIVVPFAQNDGVSPAGGSSDQFLAAIKKEIEVWRKVVNEAGVKTE